MNARLVLWAGAADAAAAVRQLCPQAAADALARAGEICGHTFLFRDHWEMEPTRQPVHVDGPVVWDAVPAGDPEWTYALNRHTIFVHLGRACQYTGEARYLDAFVSLLGDWLDRVPRTPVSENTTWRALEAGLRPENWLRARPVRAGGAGGPGPPHRREPGRPRGLPGPGPRALPAAEQLGGHPGPRAVFDRAVAGPGRLARAGPRPPGREPPPCPPARRRPVGAEPHVPLRGAPRPAGHPAFGGAQRDRRPAPPAGKSPGHVPGPGGLGRPGPHLPAPGGQRRHRRRGSAGGGGPAVPGPAAGRRGPGAPLRGDAVGLRPRRPGPAGGPAGGLARLPLPEAGGQRQLHPPLRLGQGGYLDPFPRRQPGRRPRPR